MKGILRISCSVLAVSMSVSGLATAVHAQTSQDGAAERATAARPDSGALSAGEIIVTAQKREQTLATTGIAITALGGDMLEKLGIDDAEDLAMAVPGFTLTRTNANVPVYTLRGVGFYETSLGVYPDVSVYLDEAPLPFPVLASHASLDVQRVEVLKGPQGILFGQNSTGGAINYVANKPVMRTEMGGQIGFGRFNDFEGSAYFNTPLTDNLAARLSLRVEQSDGWQRSVSRPDDRLGARKLLQGRLALRWEPTPDLTVSLNLSAWNDRSEAQAGQLVLADPQVPAASPPGFIGTPPAPDKPRAADWAANIPVGNKEDFRMASLRVDYDVADDITLTSLTSYVDFKRDDYVDTDGTAFNISDTRSTGKLTSLSQELRLAGSVGSGFRWLLGGNYQRDRTDELNYIFIEDSSTPRNLGFGNNQQPATQDMDNYAVFANAELDLAKALTFKAGGRFTQANRDYSGCSQDNGDGRVAALFTNIRRARLKDPTLPAVPPGTCVTLDENLNAGPVIGKLDENNFSWRVGLDWNVTPTSLLYANISKGYKGGSFPRSNGATVASFTRVVQESLVDYEVGAKLQLLDRSLFVDLSAFHYDYKNKQLRSKVRDNIFGLLDALVNIPKSTIDGAEAAITYQSRTGLSLNASATYLDAKIKKFVGYNIAGVFDDFGGEKVPYTPKWQLSANADYDFAVGSRLRASVGAGANYSSKSSTVIGGDPIFDIPSYILLNLRAGIGAEDDSWRVSVWAKNVTNKFYLTNVLRTTDVIFRYAGMPATYGITLSLKSN